MCSTMLAFIFFAMVPPVCGHAVLYKPRARNWVAKEECQGGKNCPSREEEFSCKDPKFGGKKAPGCKENDPQSLNGWKVKDRANGKWPSPVGSFGLCGDPVQFRDWVPMSEMAYMMPTEPQAVYTPGEIVEFEVGMYAEHYGHFEYRICDKTLDGNLTSFQEGQDCLNKWVLQRPPPSGNEPPLDKRHPGRWHIGASPEKPKVNSLNRSIVVAGEDWDDSDIIGIQTHQYIYKMKYIIPEGLECKSCTLQMYWPTANTCTLDDDVAKYWEDLGREPPSFWPGKNKCKNGQHGEEFWNCADITVKPQNSPSPPPSKDRRRRSQRRRRRRGSRRRSSTRRRTTRRRTTRRRRRTQRRRR